MVDLNGGDNVEFLNVFYIHSLIHAKIILNLGKR